MPEDTTPHGGEALHPLPDRARIPKGPGAGMASGAANDSGRPALPTGVPEMPADRIREQPQGGGKPADDNGRPSVTQQPD